MPSPSALRSIIGLFKPAQTGMLVFTALVGYLTPHAYPFSLITLLFVLVIEILAISGTTAINMYHDRDLDAMMERTKNRPIPSREISPQLTIVLGYTMLILAIFLSPFISLIFTLTVFLGYFFDIIIYTVILKRRTSLNIIFGGVAGGMPIIGGWAARTSGIGLAGILMFALIFTWIPLHTWIISAVNQSDYKKAGIPNIPSKVSSGTLFLGLFFTTLAFLFIASEIFLLGFTTYVTPLITAVFTSLVIYWSYKAFIHQDGLALKRMRVIASPMLGVVLLLLLVR